MHINLTVTPTRQTNTTYLLLRQCTIVSFRLFLEDEELGTIFNNIPTSNIVVKF